MYEWLKRQRLTGDDSYFTITEIQRGLKSSGLFPEHCRRVCAAVIQLEAFGYLDVMRLENWRRMVRLKKKYVGAPNGRL